VSFFKTPKFWYRTQDTPMPLAERILAPFSVLYGMLYHLHQRTKTRYKSDIPVICLGNLVAGGTGKTPTAVALLGLITQHKLAKTPFFLSRGYGGAEMGPILVDPKIHTAWDVGDEPLILAQYAPVIVAKDRAEGVKLARAKQADVIIMDDGLQNPGIAKDLRLLVINGEMGFGNGKLLPAGPLRQPLYQGLGKADGYILIGEDTRGISPLLHKTKPITHARIAPSGTARPDKAARYLAFAGLGYPDKFFNFLKKDMTLDIVECLRFADHYPYADTDITALKDKAKALNARLITTEKDLMRIPSQARTDIETIQIETLFDEPEALASLLKTVLKSGP